MIFRSHLRPRTAGRASIAVLAVAGLLTLTAGCTGLRRTSGRDGDDRSGATATAPTGSSARTITVDGRKRTYSLYRPASLPQGPVPLVVMLHGGLGSGTQAEKAYGWDAEADSQHFLVVYPDGLGRAWAVGGGCCGAPERDGVNDVSFITQLVGALGRQLLIDPARVYATGMSNGALLDYRLACDSTVFAAIGPNSGTLLGPCPSPAPISVIHIHGTADPNIPYNGGQGDGIAKINGPAVPALNATWRGLNQCAPPSVTTERSVTTSVATCPGGRAVELVTVAGGGHEWPGAPKLGSDTATASGLSATDTIWRFFASHPKSTVG
jgi:polyhydroxybutyrate depolymerase